MTLSNDDVFARKYAPMVYLHPQEIYFPMDADVFIHNSSLNWSHDYTFDCQDIVPKGHIDPYKLGHGGYTHRVKEFKVKVKFSWKPVDIGFKHTGREIACNEFCQPHQGICDNEGFFLNLTNSCRGGDRTLNSPAYYEFSSGNFITYWFLYGFNEPAGIGSLISTVTSPIITPYTDLGGHEGDWEGICILLNQANEPQSVNFFAHGNSPKNVSWNDITKIDESHPVVYSALGSHASYPDLGTQDVPNWFDDSVAKGNGWTTWNYVKNAKEQPWYGYGGSWGEIGENFRFVDLAGPVGPGHKNPRGG